MTTNPLVSLNVYNYLKDYQMNLLHVLVHISITKTYLSKNKCRTIYNYFNRYLNKNLPEWHYHS